ncbi:hypothetical protein Taro_030850 [Colocasia esculenta]|uniref:Uncharacterized protein n=1 Tax=Colocasia esculenta TaxID=4460 RepID=A0A843VT07_COLES|nr:hypothetical protein [Colocasia esculenta]
MQKILSDFEGVAPAFAHLLSLIRKEGRKIQSGPETTVYTPRSKSLLEYIAGDCIRPLPAAFFPSSKCWPAWLRPKQENVRLLSSGRARVGRRRRGGSRDVCYSPFGSPGSVGGDRENRVLGVGRGSGSRVVTGDALARRMAVFVFPASWSFRGVTSQRFGMVFVVLAPSSTRRLALEGLSRLEVVSISWDPHPREPFEGVLQAMGMIESMALLADSGAEGKMRLEAGAKLESIGSGRYVLLLAASGGGLVAIVVMTFPYGVSKCVDSLQGKSGAVLAVVVGMHVRVGVSRRLREPTCGVAFTGAGLLSVEPVEGLVSLLELSICSMCCVASLVERCDTCLWLLSAWCWLVVSSSDVLLEFFSVGSGRRLIYARFYLLMCYLKWRFSQDRVVSLLLAAVFSLKVSGEESFRLAMLFWPLVHLCCTLLSFGACGSTVCSCSSVALSEVDVLSSSSVVVSVPVWLCAFLVVGMLVPALCPVCAWRACCQLFIGSLIVSGVGILEIEEEIARSDSEREE